MRVCETAHDISYEAKGDSKTGDASRRRVHLSAEARLAIAVCCAFVWWDSFHEMGRFFFGARLLGNDLTHLYSYLSCLMQPAGLAAGCVALALWAHRKEAWDVSKRGIVRLMAAEAVLHVFYYACLIFGMNALVCIIHGLISACFAVNISLLVVLVARLGTRKTVLTVIAYLVCMGMVNYVLFSFVLVHVPRLSMGCFYAVVLLVGFAALLSVSGVSVPLMSGRERRALPPLPLSFHLLSYGFVFGLLHTISGHLATGPFNINLPSFFSCVIAAAILALLFLRKEPDAKNNVEIWSKIRSTVFPFTLIGFMLVPLVPDSDIALAFIGAGQILYDAIVVIACGVFTGRTFIAPIRIIATAFLFKSLGMAAGIACTAFTGAFEFTSTYTGIAALSVLVALLLTAATFWVGSDDTVRKIWGLRKSISPRRYNDAVLKLKCVRLAKDFRLTAKETEVLTMVARGKRAGEIADGMHVSINTVRSHIQHAYAKLGVHSVDDLNALLKTVTVEEKDIG